MLIKVAGKLCCIEHAGEHLFGVGTSQDATQHRVRAMPPVLALTMSVMMLDVVVLPPRLVGLLHFRPDARVGKGMVPKPSLDREQRFCIILPGLPRFDAFLANTEHLVQGIRNIGVENSPTVCNDSLWRAVAPDGIYQHRKIVPLVLCWRDGGGEHHP